MTPTELAYPDAWLLGWRDVMFEAPGDHPMPRVNVIPVKSANYDGPAGKYSPRDHVVYLYPRVTPGDELDRGDALATLVHELAHAWAPEERNHHGPAWRQTFADLYSWLTGLEVRLSVLPEITRDFRAKHGAAFKHRRRINDHVLSGMMDLVIAQAIADLKPTIRITHRNESGAPLAVAARIGDKQHRVRVKP
jgi:hypothetical protein